MIIDLEACIHLWKVEITLRQLQIDFWLICNGFSIHIRERQFELSKSDRLQSALHCQC